MGIINNRIITNIDILFRCSNINVYDTIDICFCIKCLTFEICFCAIGHFNATAAENQLYEQLL